MTNYDLRNINIQVAQQILFYYTYHSNYDNKLKLKNIFFIVHPAVDDPGTKKVLNLQDGATASVLTRVSSR
jgi:hypothetical protein